MSSLSIYILKSNCNQLHHVFHKWCSYVQTVKLQNMTHSQTHNHGQSYSCKHKNSNSAYKNGKKHSHHNHHNKKHSHHKKKCAIPNCTYNAYNRHGKKHPHCGLSCHVLQMRVFNHTSKCPCKSHLGYQKCMGQSCPCARTWAGDSNTGGSDFCKICHKAVNKAIKWNLI